jgi:oligopeptide/dipeptide ABC transporter ATP-binding protein
MYLGKIMEEAETTALFSRPLHPYTSTLLKAVPEADPSARWEGADVAGEIPDVTERIEGCPFAPRCSFAAERCRSQTPEIRSLTDADGATHRVACHFAEELELYGVR